MLTTAQIKHLRLAYTRKESPTRDRVRDLAEAYVEAFRETLREYLAFEKIETVRIESVLGIVHGQPCLSIVLHEPGRDLFVNTKIFAAANAAATYLGVHWDGIAVDGALTWGQVRVETTFAPAERGAFGSPTGRLRAI